MSGYRVSVSDEDPFAIDEALCRSQRFWQQLVIQFVGLVLSFGLWLPGMLIWLVTSSARTRRFADGYTVQLRGGQLEVGNRIDARNIPLDAIADVKVQGGVTTVSLRGAPQLLVFGLRDPRAAARAILTAREEHVRGMRADMREAVVSSDDPVGVPTARGQRPR